MTHFVGGKWIEGSGSELISSSPADGQVVWQGKAAGEKEVDQAFDEARKGFRDWYRMTLDERIAICRNYAEKVSEFAAEFARIISAEMGKPIWEAKTEVGAVAGKVELSIDAMQTRRPESAFEIGDAKAVTRYKPFGVVGVLGPFNLPAHLPNGHIIPAILAGNTVVLKPSEVTPHVAEFMLKLWEKSGLPAGVINLVQGGRDTGIQLVNHPELDGLFFTGSSAGGIAINQSLSANPQKIVALEMGGNNPLIVHECSDHKAAAYQTILSAFITSGQRCTCARRLILVEGSESDQFVETLTEMMTKIRVAVPATEPEPFMATVISPEMGIRLIDEQEKLIAYGARQIVPMKKVDQNDALISPGLLDVTDAANIEDEEIFGPLLSIFRVRDFESAIVQANNTRYGLSAGLLSDNRECFEEFIREIRAGVVNWNRQTTGASGKLAFGGTGLSGNNRPAGYFATDYCNWPVASLEASQLKMPEAIATGIDLS